MCQRSSFAELPQNLQVKCYHVDFTCLSAHKVSEEVLTFGRLLSCWIILVHFGDGTDHKRPPEPPGISTLVGPLRIEVHMLHVKSKEPSKGQRLNMVDLIRCKLNFGVLRAHNLL